MKKSWKKALALFVLTLCVIGAAGFCINWFGEAREAVEVVSERVLVPGGQSVGIKMNVKGVLVVGLEEIETENSIVSPGYTAGLEIGDIITSVNGQEVSYAKDVSEIVNRAKEDAGKKSLHMTVRRKEQSANLPGRPPPLITFLRCTLSRALRAAIRAVAASTTFSQMRLASTGCSSR